MNHPEDEKAATKFADEWAKEVDGNRDYRLVRAFLAGCSHVRTSAEWKAMNAVAVEAKNVLDLVAPGYSKAVLESALKFLDRIRKEGESG